MGENLFFPLLANFLKLFLIITSPVIFLIGIFLFYDVDIYLKIERFFAKTYGLHKKSVMSQLGKSREWLQMLLLKKRRSLGIVCLINSILNIFIIGFLLRNY
ncbi:MAG: hypothetical protein WC321_06585 [Candidatus Omnitrophota bacterium]|jgi:hypothetical protein